MYENVVKETLWDKLCASAEAEDSRFVTAMAMVFKALDAPVWQSISQ